MAEPPPRGRTTRPPPIPILRAMPGAAAPPVAPLPVAPPVAPTPAPTETGDRAPADVEPVATHAWRADAEDTRSLEAPDAAPLVESMLALVASEAEALLEGTGSGEQLAELNVRTALASWDALHQTDEALRFLELAEGHPLAPRLRFAAALAAGDSALLEAIEPAAHAVPALALELAEAYVWRFGRIDRALPLLEHLVATEMPAPWRAHAVELAALALAARGAWTRVVELRSRDLDRDSEPEAIAAAAALQLDHGRDAAAALTTCWARLETYPGALAAGDRALGWLRTLDVALDAATILDDPRRRELLGWRAALVATLPAGELEALATQHALASALERDGQATAAAAHWLQLAGDAAATTPGAARRVALLRAAWAGIAVGPAPALTARRALADSECTTVAAAHAWRALELAGVLGEPSVADLARTVADVTSSSLAERWLDQLELAAPTAATAARFETRGGIALRWAAALAERSGDRPRAIDLWKRAAAGPALPTTLDHVLRLLRGDGSSDAETYADGDELAAAYARWASIEPDQRSAAALWCARGIVDLARGDFVEAEESLQRAAALAPSDPVSRAALAAVYRASKRFEPLARILVELGASLTSPDARSQVTREHATLLDEHLGDPAGARAALERLLGERPADLDVLVALAALCERQRDPAPAAALFRRAAELAPGRERRAQLWSDVARVEEARGDRDAAVAALDRASEAAPGGAMREQARLHRASGRLDRVVAVIRQELGAAPPLARRMELQQELARTLTDLDAEPAAVVAAYLEVLGIEPDQSEALAGLEAPARQLGLWDELARAFRGAPRTPKNLEVLAEALAHIAEWSELVEVRRSQLEAATAPAERAARASELAALYERELGDVDGAIRYLQLAQSLQLTIARQQHLLRLLRLHDRWADLTAALERELPTVSPADVERQLEILQELGVLRAQRLDQPAEAATAYEAILERRPGEPTATAALERLYEQLGRDRELTRLLETRAETATEPAERAALFTRVATLRHSRGDIDGSLAAYTAAFQADPASRDVFTAMERVCYQAERWAVAMQLYESAIAHVEGGGSRAYRLGDLYSRRANVQLGFLGQVDAAIASFQKVIEVDSQPQAAVQSLDELLRKRGSDLQPLIQAWVQRAEYQKDVTRKGDALRSAAALAAEVEDAQLVIELQLKLLALDPGDAAAARRIEQFYEDAQDKSGLVDVLKLQLQHTTGDAALALMKRIARASEDGARDVETATEHYLKMLEVEPENRDALEALGRIYESTEQWAELVEITRRQIKVTPDRTTKALLYFRCGSVMEAKFGREADAIRYYEAAIKTAPSCLPAVHGLRDLYRRKADWPRVIETLELEVKLWQDDKERAGVFAQIGGVYGQQLGDAERALQFYDSALAVDPDCLPANQALFEHFFEQAAWAKAQPLANALAQKAMRDGDPSTRSEFYRKRGVVSRMTGDLRGAADSFIVALETKPTNAAALDNLRTLAREHPDVWDFATTYRELEKVYRKRDDADALLARVHVGRAVIVEREGDLDQAAGMYRQALELAPGDVAIMSALVDFHADMRRWPEAISAIETFIAADTSVADRVAALMRRAAIHGDGEMDAQRAVAVLHEVLRIDPSHEDAYYVIAQQYFLLGSYAEARTAVDRLLELATAPDQALSPSALARYYYYKGRILDASGEARAATSQYRRATEYDPGYAPPALVLARRAADAGDRATAETLLIDAAHAAMARGGAPAAVPLQRGLARILLAAGDRPAAIEAYRGILGALPGSASDRVALAEIYAVDDPQRAISELRKVIERDIHHAPAYRLLASYYHRIGETERASRVMTAIDLLGFAEEVDRHASRRMRGARLTDPLRSTMDEATRARYLLTPAALSPMGEVFAAFAEQLSAFIPAPSLGANLQPAIAEGETRLVRLCAEVASLFEIDADIFIGEKVPGLAAVTAFPRRMIVLDRQLVGEEDGPLRFLFGYALEAIRGGYAALLNIGARHRRELAQLLLALLSPDGQVSGPAGELVDSAAMRMSVQQMLERVSTPEAQELDPSAWIDGMLALAKRAGLVACDDFVPAIWMVARLSGETMTSTDDSVALGAVLGGPDLVRFYLSDDYQQLRDLLTVAPRS